MWHEILTHTWDKFMTWLDRVKGKYDYQWKLRNEQYGGEAPAILSSGGLAKFRDSGPDLSNSHVV